MDDPDYEDHSLLEQYQAQIGAALRPAFTPDTPAAVMAQACRLCALYITCGVATEAVDQSKTLRLLLSVFERAAHGTAGAAGDGTVLACGKPDEIVYNESVRKVYLGEHFRL